MRVCSAPSVFWGCAQCEFALLQVAYPENWGIIVYDEMIDFSASPLFPESARKQLNELMTTPEYTLVFGTGSSSPSLASSTAGDAILGIVQIPDSSGSNYLSIPHSSNPGAMAFFRNGCFTTNTNVPQPCTVQVSLHDALPCALPRPALAPNALGCWGKVADSQWPGQSRGS